MIAFFNMMDSAWVRTESHPGAPVRIPPSPPANQGPSLKGPFLLGKPRLSRRSGRQVNDPCYFRSPHVSAELRHIDADQCKRTARLGIREQCLLLLIRSADRLST